MDHCDVNFVGGLTLNEALTIAYDDDLPEAGIDIYMLPPENACGDITDEDSGDENNLIIDNLPANQLRAPVEISFNNSAKSSATYDSDDDDEEHTMPLSELAKRLSKKSNRVVKRKKTDLKWVNKDYEIIDSDDEWQSDVSEVTAKKHPLEIFQMFFDNDLVELIVNESNRYANQKNKEGNISSREIRSFLGVLLLSGYLQPARRRMFWEREEDTHNELIAEAISRDRFEYVMSNLHFADNNNLQKSDKFAKLRPLFRHINAKFLENAPLQKSHSIDEAMVPYYGRHGCKQYIKGKPIRYGYKLWAGSTRLGYVNWFEPYQGATTHIGTLYTELGVGAGVVLTYADTLRSKWDSHKFHFYFDNFFNSADLLISLQNKNIQGTGTIRCNRLTNNPFASIDLKKRKRGDYECRIAEEKNIVAVQWNDNNIVTMCSNSLGAKPISIVKRYSQLHKKIIQIEQPYVVKKYNANMGGIDRCDENISLYRTSIRGKKWYFPLIVQCIDMAVHNAWQLHKNNNGRMDHLCFRRSVAKALLRQNKKPCSSSKGRPSQNENMDIRFDRIDHFVIPQDKQTKCRYCHTKTTTRCLKCDVGVHVKCFVAYHT